MVKTILIKVHRPVGKQEVWRFETKELRDFHKTAILAADTARKWFESMGHVKIDKIRVAKKVFVRQKVDEIWEGPD